MIFIILSNILFGDIFGNLVEDGNVRVFFWCFWSFIFVFVCTVVILFLFDFESRG